eukprot:150590_1
MIHICASYSAPRLPSRVPIHPPPIEHDTIVSIDIGSYGFAASYLQKCTNGNLVPRMIGESSSIPLELGKNLCAILIERETHQTMAIGYNAWELYRKLCIKLKGNHKYMYFQHPHKSIYNVVDVANPYNIRIHAVDNISSLPLSTVITKLVQGIMKQVLECINMWNTLAGIPLVKYYADICWIIPIPIVWFYSVETVQFMDYCLRDAGMTTFHLCGDTIA